MKKENEIIEKTQLMQNNKKCIFVSIVGEPNAGKSTLLNILINKKVSIVSPKIQTTRRQIRGITEINDTQIVFTDTPGFFHKSSSPLEKVIYSNFKNSYKDSDLIILVIDSTSKNIENSIKFVERLEVSRIPLVVIINKVDIAKKESILKIAETLSCYDFIKQIFMISALKSDGIDDVKNFILSQAYESPWFYPENTFSDAPLEFQLSEITREKIFYNLEKELPYNIYVETESVHHTEKKAKIFQSIVVMKDSQKGIVLGKCGNMIKKIKYESINDMKNLLNKKIELTLFVKVKEKWTEKKAHLQNAGIID